MPWKTKLAAGRHLCFSWDTAMELLSNALWQCDPRGSTALLICGFSKATSGGLTSKGNHTDSCSSFIWGGDAAGLSHHQTQQPAQKWEGKIPGVRQRSMWKNSLSQLLTFACCGWGITHFHCNNCLIHEPCYAPSQFFAARVNSRYTCCSSAGRRQARNVPDETKPSCTDRVWCEHGEKGRKQHPPHKSGNLTFGNCLCFNKDYQLHTFVAICSVSHWSLE